jgi:hypothetical protein
MSEATKICATTIAIVERSLIYLSRAVKERRCIFKAIGINKGERTKDQMVLPKISSIKDDKDATS